MEICVYIKNIKNRNNLLGYATENSLLNHRRITKIEKIKEEMLFLEKKTKRECLKKLTTAIPMCKHLWQRAISNVLCRMEQEAG